MNKTGASAAIERGKHGIHPDSFLGANALPGVTDAIHRKHRVRIEPMLLAHNFHFGEDAS
jgi:hypothetical protein